MTEESRAVAIPSPRGELVPEWWARAYGPRTMYHTTLDLSKPENKALLLRSINEDCEPAKSVLNVPIEIVGYTISPAAREDEGEMQEWVRCVLHLADGRNVSCGSMGVLKSLMVIEQLDRPAPWNPPLVKVLRAKDIAGNRQWYSLVDPPAAKKGKG